MPTVSAQGLVVELCSGVSGKTVTIDLGKKLPSETQKHAADSPCVFAAGLGHGLLTSAELPTIQPFVYGLTIFVGTAIADLTISRLANDTFRIGLIASREKGDDTRFPGGRIATTGYERAVYGVHAGLRAGSGELSLEYRRQETGRSGNPPFAMDIIYFHTNFVRIGFEGDLADGVRLEAHAAYAGVSHRMNNFELRPAPTTAMTRQSDTYADTIGADISLRFGSASRYVRLGADVELIDKGYMLYNPLATNFFIHPLDHAESDRLGAFAEWRGGLGPVEVELGARLDRHGAETGAPRFGPGVPLGPANLALAFANADRD